MTSTALTGYDCSGGLASVLAAAGLGAYEQLFRQQEVNLHEFLTLSDADLKECGIR